METRIIALLLALLVSGCNRCVMLRIESPTGEPARRISQDYVRTYGCASFDEVTTFEEMLAWCVAHDLGDTVSSDVSPGCRPDGTGPPCERFWVCE
jgi:hypothetical protein